MKYAVSSLMVAVSALAFSANANASDFKPYVGLDYNIPTPMPTIRARNTIPPWLTSVPNITNISEPKFSTSIPMTTKNMLTALKIKLLSRLTVWI